MFNFVRIKRVYFYRVVETHKLIELTNGIAKNRPAINKRASEQAEGII